MPYDEELAQRTTSVLAQHTEFRPQKMMGGIVYMVNGHMCCGVTGDSLLVRVGPDARDTALAKPHTRPMTFGGRSPKGFIFVDAPACSTNKTLNKWVNTALEFVKTLPPKKP